jgi:hypothetical protein
MTGVGRNEPCPCGSGKKHENKGLPFSPTKRTDKHT